MNIVLTHRAEVVESVAHDVANGAAALAGAATLLTERWNHLTAAQRTDMLDIVAVGSRRQAKIVDELLPHLPDELLGHVRRLIDDEAGTRADLV